MYIFSELNAQFFCMCSYFQRLLLMTAPIRKTPATTTQSSRQMALQRSSLSKRHRTRLERRWNEMISDTDRLAYHAVHADLLTNS